MTRNYNRSRYSATSVYTDLNNSREAHGKTLDELHETQKRLRQLELAASHFWEFGDNCPNRDCDLCVFMWKNHRTVGHVE